MFTSPQLPIPKLYPNSQIPKKQVMVASKTLVCTFALCSINMIHVIKCYSLTIILNMTIRNYMYTNLY